MRIASIAAGLVFVFALENAVRSQEPDKRPRHDQSLINDVEASNKKATAGHDHPDTGAGAPSNPALPATLAEALAQALQSSPAVQLAEAKLRQAEAEYNQAKLQTVQDVTVAFPQLNSIRQKLDYAQKMNKKGFASAPEVQELTIELVASEAKLTYLLGIGADSRQAPGGRKVVAKPIETIRTIRITGVAEEPAAKKEAADHGAAEKRPEIPQKYRKILQKPMKVNFKAMPLNQILDQLNQATGDELPILQQLENFDPRPVNVELAEEIPLQTVLEMLADLTGCVFIFRDYGLLVSLSASRYPRAATIPEHRGHGTPGPYQNEY